MRPSNLLAAAAFFGAVPLGLACAYLGYRFGYYPYAALPFVLVGVFVVIFGCLLVVLPRLRSAERRR